MFISTRDKNRRVNFTQAVFEGLAPDGGLYHFEKMPDFSKIIDGFSSSQSFAEIASVMTENLFPDLFSSEKAAEISKKAFPFSPELTWMEDDVACLELYHGPSCAFKDFGASFLATVMEEFLAEKEQRAVILTATSGDTGSAVAQAFYNKKNIDVVILYPSNRVSPLQEKQLTTLGCNIHALEIKGSFDDCQRMVKEAFIDRQLKKKYCLTSANSINLGRLIPQTFYYIWAWIQLKKKAEKIVFCVPSGNFGNLTAGLYADFWGMRTDFFIAATNINDVVPEYLISGKFTPRNSSKTCSNAMDVGNPSNFERMLSLFDSSHEKMKQKIHQEVVTDAETLKVIQDFYKLTGRFIDPHTAVGYKAIKNYKSENPDYKGTIINISTAHPGKFPEIVNKAAGRNVELPVQLKKLLDLEKKSTVIDNNLADLAGFLKKTFPEL